MLQSRDVAADMLSRIRRLTVILNPAAGKGLAGRQHNELDSLLSRAVRNLHDIVSWRVVETTAPGHAEVLAREAVESGAQMVIAAGGDGTLYEVLNGVMGSDVKLGVIPMGSGNDFARTIGVGQTIKDAVLSIFYGDPVAIDVGKINDRYFINVAGCGFDAVIADRMNTTNGKLRGRAGYIAAVYMELKKFEPFEMKLTLDGESREVRAILCAVANARCYGGGMKIAPNAFINDGLFDICIVTADKWEFIKSFPKVFKGTHISHPDVFMSRAKVVKIETTTPQPILIDGEMYGTSPAEFTILPKAITFLGPERRPGSDGEQYGIMDPA